MIAIQVGNVSSVIRQFDAEIQAHITKLKKDLARLRANKAIIGKRKAYLDLLIKLIDDIVTATPRTIRKYQILFDGAISPNQMSGGKYEVFRKQLIKALGYENLRASFYPKYFHRIGIKSCVYCNAQLTVSIDSKKKFKAKFQVDHYLPKSEYPCFSISLFNLYPSCANCNNCKSASKVNFALYSYSKSLSSPFHFELDKACIAKYLTRRDPAVIAHEFKCPRGSKGGKSFQEAFDIQGIYDTQKDIVEELILKREIYTKGYRSSLSTQFPRIFTTQVIANRIIVGNYTAEEDIHKRPMAKFTSDMAKQVGLI